MVRCEELFRQICWLAERYWPAIDENGGWIDPPMGYTIPGTRPVTMNRNVVHPNMTAPSMHAPGMNMHGNPVNGNMAGPAPTPNMHGHVNTNMSNNANPNPNINTSTSMNTNANNSNNNRNNPAPIAPINAGVRKESTSVNDNRSQQSMDRGNSMDSDSGESSA